MTEHSYRISDRAKCDLCDRIIEFRGEYWQHLEGRFRHHATPRRGTVISPVAELEQERDDLLAACAVALEWFAQYPFNNATFERQTANEVYDRLDAAIAKARNK